MIPKEKNGCQQWKRVICLFLTYKNFGIFPGVGGWRLEKNNV